MKLFAAELAAGADAHATAYALLRHAVARCCAMPCPDIRCAPDGKPFFVGQEQPFFSLSHTKTHVLVALSAHAVGVDVETRRPVPQRLRDRLFTPEEQRSFDFFEGWTLREAVFKLTGAGGLMTMRLAQTTQGIRTPFPGVRCRSYDGIPGCAAAAACLEGDFPDAIEIVSADVFFS